MESIGLYLGRGADLKVDFYKVASVANALKCSRATWPSNSSPKYELALQNQAGVLLRCRVWTHPVVLETFTFFTFFSAFGLLL